MRPAAAVALMVMGVVRPTLAQLVTEGQIPSDVYTRPATLVAVDDERRLNMFCLGNGTPLIVFVSGAWDNTMAWRRVQGATSGLSRACSYDRAGLGFSDPSTRPSTALSAADDLKKLLDAASVETPVVLVGHSAGGLYAMLFTALYPERVAGLVLVDPSDPEANHNYTLSGHLPPAVVEGSRQRRRPVASSLRRLGSGQAVDT
jgi:pimeloyl-ACP methyl ester carboxylesterase